MILIGGAIILFGRVASGASSRALCSAWCLPPRCSTSLVQTRTRCSPCRGTGTGAGRLCVWHDVHGHRSRLGFLYRRKWCYGALIGVMCVLIRVVNPAYPEGMMLAILFANLFAPLFDYWSCAPTLSGGRRVAEVKITTASAKRCWWFWYCVWSVPSWLPVPP